MTRLMCCVCDAHSTRVKLTCVTVKVVERVVGICYKLIQKNDLSISRPFIAGFIHVYRHSHTWTITTGTALPLCIAS